MKSEALEVYREPESCGLRRRWRTSSKDDISPNNEEQQQLDIPFSDLSEVPSKQRLSVVPCLPEQDRIRQRAFHVQGGCLD